MRPETAAHLLRLALAQKDCPGPTDASVNLDYYVYPIPGQSPHSPDCICKGTGKVPLFPDTVRVPCPHTSGDWESSGSTDSTGRMPLPDMWLCSGCQGRGEMPSADPIVWAKALFTIGDGADWTLHALEDMTEWGFWQFLFLSGDFEAALPHAVKAMELAGVLEVPDVTM